MAIVTRMMTRRTTRRRIVMRRGRVARSQLRRWLSHARGQADAERDHSRRDPERDPDHRRRSHPIPHRQRDRPETVDEEEHAAVTAIVVDAGGDARAEDQRGDEAEDDVEDVDHVRYRTSITLRTTSLA